MKHLKFVSCFFYLFNISTIFTHLITWVKTVDMLGNTILKFSNSISHKSVVLGSNCLLKLDSALVEQALLLSCPYNTYPMESNLSNVEAKIIFHICYGISNWETFQVSVQCDNELHLVEIPRNCILIINLIYFHWAFIYFLLIIPIRYSTFYKMLIECTHKLYGQFVAKN